MRATPARTRPVRQNGLWTAAISWGVTLSTGAMRRWGQVCALLFAALTLFFAGAFYGALSYDLQADTTPQQRTVLNKVLAKQEVDHSHEGGGHASGQGSEVQMKAENDGG